MFVTTSARIGSGSVAARVFRRGSVSIRDDCAPQTRPAIGQANRRSDVTYRMMGALHARLAALGTGERGQGTVEYVALILLVAALLAGIVAATKGTKWGTGRIAETIVSQITGALRALR
jgi:hypothetical protein